MDRKEKRKSLQLGRFKGLKVRSQRSPSVDKSAAAAEASLPDVPIDDAVAAAVNAALKQPQSAVELALKDLMGAVERQPSQPPTLGAATLHTMEGNYREAAKRVDQALAIDPAHRYALKLRQRISEEYIRRSAYQRALGQ